MKLIDQHTKGIMEECKEKAAAAGLAVEGETLEFIISNRDLLRLLPKKMVPTLYDFWVEDVEVVKNEWLYEVFPHNPYETVINTRPAISFYNSDNPDWLNVMIFYHVLAHIDFFQNNVFFQRTWDDDFCGQALADKRVIEGIREELGSERRWVDYVIEFARGVDNLVGFYPELAAVDKIPPQNDAKKALSEKTAFYFGRFLKEKYQEKAIVLGFYDEEVKRFNRQGEEAFFEDPDFISRFPEFSNVFKKHCQKKKTAPCDILQYLLENSAFLNQEENLWMKRVIQIVRRTSLYFQPQIRTTIANEGWASLWHERLFIADDRIKGREVDFARVNASVLPVPRLGFNPYAVGKMLFEFIEDMAERGKFSWEYQTLKDSEARRRYCQSGGKKSGRRALFDARKNFNDFMLVNFLSEEDFQDFVDKHRLFIAGVRPSSKRLDHLEIYIKSKLGKKYRQMINKHLYHPPCCVIDEEKAAAKKGALYLDHLFEGRSLVTKYISPVLIGLSFLLGGEEVYLETTEFHIDDTGDGYGGFLHPAYHKFRVLYHCKEKYVGKKTLSDSD